MNTRLKMMLSLVRPSRMKNAKTSLKDTPQNKNVPNGQGRCAHLKNKSCWSILQKQIVRKCLGNFVVHQDAFCNLGLLNVLTRKKLSSLRYWNHSTLPLCSSTTQYFLMNTFIVKVFNLTPYLVLFSGSWGNLQPWAPKILQTRDQVGTFAQTFRRMCRHPKGGLFKTANQS